MSIAIVPARGGSKGILRKNLALINGKSLVELAVGSAIDSGMFESVYLDTDDEEIAQIGKSAGAIVPFLRSPDLATDEAGILDCVRHFCAQIGEEAIPPGVSIALLQPTNPLRTVKEIVDCLEIWEKNGGNFSVVAVAEPMQSAKDFVKIESDGSCQTLSGQNFRVTNRQSLPSVKFISGSIYVFTRDFLDFHGQLVTEKNTIFFETSQQSSLDVDTEFDLHIVRLLSKNLFDG